MYLSYIECTLLKLWVHIIVIAELLNCIQNLTHICTYLINILLLWATLPAHLDLHISEYVHIVKSYIYKYMYIWSSSKITMCKWCSYVYIICINHTYAQMQHVWIIWNMYIFALSKWIYSICTYSQSLTSYVLCTYDI